MAYYDAGTYQCIVTDQGFSKTQGGTPFFFLTIRPLKCGDEEVSGEYTREVKLWMTEKAVERSVERLRSLGWEGDTLASLEPGAGHSFDGLNVTLRCTHSESNGKIYENWDFPGPVGGSASGGIEHAEGVAHKLDALFGKMLKTKKPDQPKKTETPF